MRFHPILKRRMMHRGVDYGAPTGTRVWSVADGTVIRAGWAGGYGNLVAIRHGGNLVSKYGHLSRIHVRVGQRVSQRQVIGRVGSTGRSTGPHLHFELVLNGKSINPSRAKIGIPKKLPKKYMPQLQEIIREVDKEWEKTPVLSDEDEPEGVFRKVP